MSIHQSIAQVFENNMGNRITPELAAGMIRSLIDILATGVQPQADASVLAAEAQAVAKVRVQEGGNGVV